MKSQPQQRLVTFDDVASAPLHVALVEPEIPPNAGNVARLCAATGCALHLIEPLGFAIEDRELKRAGLDYWHLLAVVIHPSLDEFLETTKARRRWFFTTRASAVYADAPFERGDVLIFGKETKGLPAEVVARYADSCLRIPMRDDSVRSINLSTAVGVATYAALARIGFPDLR
ncbi:MAG TPA: tRNA (cytidine(34)-2'-O)-methyltransferase [Verrucomicrobiae bacterium]|jgi:tRNA (cytidine/uridine-2'-O-)-methyltransferase|nr:tRNA (cytidine(34)-2'-O)-methyltransferase [Verrucomicrobiae bacterium]